MTTIYHRLYPHLRFNLPMNDRENNIGVTNDLIEKYVKPVNDKPIDEPKEEIIEKFETPVVEDKPQTTEPIKEDTVKENTFEVKLNSPKVKPKPKPKPKLKTTPKPKPTDEDKKQRFMDLLTKKSEKKAMEEIAKVNEVLEKAPTSELIKKEQKELRQKLKLINKAKLFTLTNNIENQHAEQKEIDKGEGEIAEDLLSKSE